MVSVPAQYRSIGDVQQRLRILRIGQRHDMLVLALSPGARLFDLRLIVGIEQQVGESGADDAAQSAVSGAKNRLRQAEGREQLALRLTANSANQRQSQPIAKRLAAGHRLRRANEVVDLDGPFGLDDQGVRNTLEGAEDEDQSSAFRRNLNVHFAVLFVALDDRPVALKREHVADFQAVLSAAVERDDRSP